MIPTTPVSPVWQFSLPSRPTDIILFRKSNESVDHLKPVRAFGKGAQVVRFTDFYEYPP